MSTQPISRIGRQGHVLGVMALFIAFTAAAEPQPRTAPRAAAPGETKAVDPASAAGKARASAQASGGVGGALANGGSPDSVSPKAPPTSGSSKSGFAGTSLVDDDSAAENDLPPQELRARGIDAVGSIEASSKSVRAMATAAKDKRDVVKVLCLDDKTTQVSAALETSKERLEALQEALDASAMERGRHEYVMLMTLKDRVNTLMNEANQCIGEETGFTGDAVLSVQIDPNLPEVEADVVGFVSIVAIPPSLASAVY